MDNLSKILIGFFALIIGAGLIGVVASGALDVTAKTNIYNEAIDLEANGCIEEGTDGGTINEASANCNITLANNPTSWKVIDCPITAITVRNTTDGAWTAIVDGTDYELFNSNGLVQMLNTTDTRRGDFNDTYISYTYCGEGYMNLSWGRTILNLVAGFFGLALLGVGLGLFYSIAKSTGIMK